MNEINPWTDKRYEEMDLVITQHYLKGVVKPYAIANKTGIPVAKVKQYIEEFKQYARTDANVRDRMLVMVTESQTALAGLIEEAHSVIDDIDVSGGTHRDKLNAIRLVADLQTKKQSALADISDVDAANAEEMMMLEGKLKKVEEMLVTLTEKFPETKNFVIGQLSTIDSTVGIEA